MLMLIKFLINFFIFQIVYSQLFPHIIWLYWDKGYQNMGNFQKLCLQRVKYLHKQTDWKINFLQEKTIDKWLNQENKKRFKQIISYKSDVPQLKADLLRYYLLKQYGGVWMDISIILKQNLNWVDNLLQNPKIFHRNMFKRPQAFIHFQHIGSQMQTVSIEMQSQRYYPLFLVENAFIAAVKQSRFINDWINQFEDLIKYGKNHYYMQQHKVGVPYDYDDYFMSFRACSINQYRKFNQFLIAKYNNKTLSHLQNTFYNVLTMNRQVGMYHGSINFQRVAEFLISPEGKLGDYQSPLIKISHGPTNRFVKWVLQNNKTMIQKHFKNMFPKTYQFGKQSIRPQYSCLYSFYIHQDSALNKYLLTNYQHAMKLFPSLQIVKDNQLPFICRIATLVTLRYIFFEVIQQFQKVIVLLFILQLVFAYVFLYIKLSIAYLNYLKSVKSLLVLKLTYLKIIYLQAKSIFSQYQLWKIESPTAIFVGFVHILCSILLLKCFLNLISRSKNANQVLHILFLLVVVVGQFYIQYSNSVWKYEGQIYNYEMLNRVNKRKIQQSGIQIIKLISFIVIGYFFNYLKKIFKIQESVKRKQNGEFIQMNQKSNKKQHYSVYNLRERQIQSQILFQNQREKILQ